MRTLLLVLLLLSACFCNRPPQEAFKAHPLIPTGYRDKGTIVSSYLAGGKVLPAIAQGRSDGTTFYHRLPDKAQLRYNFVSDSPGRGRITIASDYPSRLVQEFWVDTEGPKTISLKEFGGRVVQITFAAEFEAGDTAQRLYWINPTIQYMANDEQGIPLELQNFRRNHERDNVLLVLFDAAAASHMSCYGYPRKTTPYVDALARGGILFENAISQAPFTTASTATLLTGFYPIVHGVGMEIDFLDESYHTLAESFLHAGYETALFSGNPNASPLVGFGQGFRKVWRHRKPTPSDAADFVPEVTSWLNRVQEKPFFAYLHFREPHVPYTPPHEFLARFSADESLIEPYQRLPKWGRIRLAAYDANLAYVDFQLGRILDLLKSTGKWNRTIVIVLADHGEAFREHGFRGHVRAVYDELIRIPLIVRFPGELQLAGVRRSGTVGTLDIAPTLVHLLGGKKFVSGNGASLLPMLVTGSDFLDRALISQSRPPWNSFSLRSREFKLISQLGTPVPDKFYWITKDPYEQKNVIGDFPILSRYYRLKLQDQIEQLKREGSRMPRPPKGSQIIDEDAREQLRALGYVDN